MVISIFLCFTVNIFYIFYTFFSPDSDSGPGLERECLAVDIIFLEFVMEGLRGHPQIPGCHGRIAPGFFQGDTDHSLFTGCLGLEQAAANSMARGHPFRDIRFPERKNRVFLPERGKDVGGQMPQADDLVLAHHVHGSLDDVL